MIESLTFDERKQLTKMLSAIVQSSNINRFSDLKSIDTIPKFFEIIKNGSKDEKDKELLQRLAKRTAVTIKNNTLNRSGLSKFTTPYLE